MDFTLIKALVVTCLLSVFVSAISYREMGVSYLTALLLFGLTLSLIFVLGFFVGTDM